MAIRMTYITYTAEAHRAIIDGRQNREPVMRALIEDAGGKFLGFYGLIGRPEGDGVVISDFDELSRLYECSSKNYDVRRHIRHYNCSLLHWRRCSGGNHQSCRYAIHTPDRLMC